MIQGGYAGKILRVDLTGQKTWTEPLPEEPTLRKLVGGVGLGMKYLLEEVPPTARPLEPENRLVFLTGPLSATLAPSSSRYIAMTVNPHVPKAVGTSWGGGGWATYLRSSGLDGIIIQGASRDPVYLVVKEGEAEIRDASKIWGRDTTETDFLIKKEVGQEPSVACIGPGGESMAAGGCITNDRNHIAAKGGCGSVMGSKKLKAIAIRLGKFRVPIANRKKAAELASRHRDTIMAGGITRFLKDGGVPRGYNGVSDKYFAMVKNMSDPEFGHTFTKAVMDTLSVSKQTPRPCPGCAIGCAYDVEIGTGPYKGYLLALAGGAESLEGLAGNIGVAEGGTTFYLTDLLDRLGLDATITGETIAMAYEAYEKGLLTKERTDGLELTWGNSNAAIQLLHKLVKREGFGNVLAEGPKATAAYIGGNAYELSNHIKNAGCAAHDIRTSWEIMLCSFVSGAPGAWQGQGVDGWGPEPDVGFEGVYQPFDVERAPVAVRKTQQKKQFEDCCGICGFSAWWVKGSVPYLADMIPAVVGWNDFTREESLMVADRVTNMQRIFNMKRGLTKADDFDIGPRLLEAPPVGPAKGKSIKPHLESFITRYYGLMGWDEATGKPLDATIRTLGLEEYAK